jgi:thioredoxin 1
MSNASRVAIVVAVIAAVVVIVSLRQACPCRAPRGGPSTTSPSAADTSAPAAATYPVTGIVSQPSIAPRALPRLVDLGADKCIPCKMMEPVLEGLRQEYVDRLRVEFYDVWKNPQIGRQHGIRVIPTQMFFGKDGKELWRHEGFLGKDDILAKWKELGIVLTPGGSSGSAQTGPAATPH